jgi:hypothetical protein
MQPEIKFINKIIRLRKRCDKLKANKKPGVMTHVMFLDRHIQANKYNKPETAKSFLKRELLRVTYIIPSQNKAMFEELNEFLN